MELMMMMRMKMQRSRSGFSLNVCVLIFALIVGVFPYAFAQKLSFEQADALFGNQRILTFRQFSLKLTDDSRNELQQMAEVIKVTPDLVKTNLLIIQTFTCEKELKIKPYLGTVRGQVIIDFLEKTIGMPRKKCLIRDAGSNPLDKDCVAGSGVNVYLRPDWRGDQ
jgi:hypothetical protein